MGRCYPPAQRLSARGAQKKARLQRTPGWDGEVLRSNWKKLQQPHRPTRPAVLPTAGTTFLHQTQRSEDRPEPRGSIVLEDLQVKNMSRSARGTVEGPGPAAWRGRAGLEQGGCWIEEGWGHVPASCWSINSSGGAGEVIAVPPRYTSQECPECHHVSKDNRPQQALFSCVACGYTYHAELVAARNIDTLALGHRERLKRLLAPLGATGITVL